MTNAPFIVAAEAIKESGRIEKLGDEELQAKNYFRSVSLYSQANAIAVFARKMTPESEHKKALRALGERTGAKLEKLVQNLTISR